MNVRELEKTLGVAHILADDVITTDDLPPALAARSANVPDAAVNTHRSSCRPRSRHNLIDAGRPVACHPCKVTATGC
jgi:transcriptional regulator of acetoin/glycerol metabolism